MEIESCFNSLKVQGDSRNIENFKDLMVIVDNDLQKGLDIEFPKPRSDWRILAREIGYFTCVDMVIEKEDILYMSIASTFVPPIRGLKKIAKLLPDLKMWLKYFDYDANIMGVAKAERGKVIDQRLNFTNIKEPSDQARTQRCPETYF